METNFRILVVHDDLSEGSRIANLLDRSKFKATCARNERECLDAVRNSLTLPHLILLDSSMPGADGLETLRSIRKIRPELPVAMMAGFMSGAFVLQASQAGAQAFLHKPVHPEELDQLATEFCIEREDAPARNESSVLLEELEHGNFFLATSPVMRQIAEQVRTIARTNVPVLITGESGSGKEIIAQLLHKHSLRASRQMLKVNCAALPADLLESELFGYEAGAFTGAMKAKPGKFEICDKGTILLDEIGEMSPALQAKLLQVLQDGQFSRLGARGNTKVDVRILAATNIDIEKSIANRTFREDLYYRLNAFVIRVPPLRERSQEIPYLLSELSARLAVANRLEPISFSPRIIAAAVEYHWPGNLRELGNFLKRYLIMRDEAAAVVELESKTHSHGFFPAFPPTQHRVAQSDPGLKSVVRTMKDQTEIKIIREVLDQANWNRRIAAEKLQISYKALLYKIRQYHLEASA
jgi:two-component system, NtrC family, response regulator AtoC